MGFFLTPHIFYDRIWQMIESYNTRHFLTQKREDTRIKSTFGNMICSTAPLQYCCNFRFTQHIMHFIPYTGAIYAMYHPESADKRMAYMTHILLLTLFSFMFQK